MFPSLRFMFAAVLSTLVILVIASSALISTRRPEVPMVLQPVGSRSLASNWMNDAQSFEARFGPQAMLVNASVQLPPKEPILDRSRPARIEFVATANAAADPATSVEPAMHAHKLIPANMEAPPSVAASTEEPLNVVPLVTATPSPERQASLPVAAKLDSPVIVAAIEPAPVPAKDPQTASDAPAQPSDRIAAAPPAAPAAERPTFSDTSRTEPIVKPAVKRRAQIKRPKKRVVQAIARPAAKPSAAKPNTQTPTNPFAALFGPSNTH